jgi:hypothetical protein
MPSYPLHLYSTLATISAAISLLGSSAMLYVISKPRDELKTALHLILFCLCIGDIMMSLAFVVTKAIVKFDARLNADGEPTYSIPVATNQAACNAQGFVFIMGGIVSSFYNCSLCVYYLYVIKFNYSEAKSRRRLNHISTQFLGRGRHSAPSMH